MQMTARQRWIALTLLAAIEFMILLDTSIVNIALPAIQTGLHFSEADLGWVQNIYQLIFGSLLLFGGRAADLFGRRKLYLLGLALFTLGSLLAGVAPTAAVLLLARGLQGLGAAVVIPAEQSLLVTIFTDPQERNRAFTRTQSSIRHLERVGCSGWSLWRGVGRSAHAVARLALDLFDQCAHRRACAPAQLALHP